MKKAINIFIILAGIALCGYVLVLASAKNHTNGANRRPAPAPSAPGAAGNAGSEKKIARVKVSVVNPRPMREYLLLPGTVEAWEDIDLSAKVGGTVEWLGPKEGDKVTSGEIILQLDAASRQALFNQAQATFSQAQKQYERIERLVRDQVVNRSELDNALAARDVARANLEVARVGLSDATLRSPIDGVIDRIRVDQGEHVNAGQVVAKIVQTERIKILVNMPEKDVAYCKEGQDVGVFIGEARLDQMLTGKVYYVALTAEPIDHTYPMRVRMDNRDGKLRPGMIVRVGLVRRSFDNALAVPLFAVVDRGDRKVVFVEKDGHAVQRPVSLGIIEGDKIQVTSGLSPGDRLIVVGHRDLVDGAEAEVEGTVEP
jgi:membrane fusion protein (multidrug efflux system)